MCWQFRVVKQLLLLAQSLVLFQLAAKICSLCPGVFGEGGTPVPISNTAVKPFSVDDTLLGESRTTPGLRLQTTISLLQERFFVNCLFDIAGRVLL